MGSSSQINEQELVEADAKFKKVRAEADGAA
jgi:hypothetical protein